MTDKPDYIRVTTCPCSDPPAQVRLIRSEIFHSMPGGIPLSWVGEAAPANPLPDVITVGLSHAF